MWRYTGKLDCIVQAVGCGNVVCAGTCVDGASSCSCHVSAQALPCLPDAEGSDNLKNARADGAAVYGLSLRQRQLLALTRAVLASALNGSRVLVVEVLFASKSLCV